MTEGNSNFGCVFVFWDYLFCTYSSVAQSKLQQLTFGIAENQSPEVDSLRAYLLNPVRLR